MYHGYSGGHRGFGRGYGRGHGAGRGMGPSGYCICLKCGYRVAKQPGVRCMDMRCPNCGAVLIREGSEHHQLYLQRKGKHFSSGSPSH